MLPMSGLRRYSDFAAYNAWANARLYDAAAALGPEPCARPAGAFFGSLIGTFNHILVADRIWLSRLAAADTPQPALDTILADDLPQLRALREAEDARILAFVAGLDEGRLAAEVSYANSAGGRFSQSLCSILDHVFNHQTHHRGQAHGLLTLLGGRAAAPSLDLIQFLRERA